LSLSDVWNKGKEIVSRNPILFLLPVILDLIIYGPLISRSGTTIHFKLTIPSSLPTIQNLLPDAAALSGEAAGGFSGISTYPGTILAGTLAAALITLVVFPWLTGGYLGTIVQDIKKPAETMSFTRLAGKYFMRLFLMQVLTIAAMFVLFPLFTVPVLNFFIFIGLLILLILLFFWDYSIVYDDLDVLAALKKAYRVFTANFGTLATILLPVALLLGLLSAITSAMMYTWVFVPIIAAYAYLGSVLVSGFMVLYASLSNPQSMAQQDVHIHIE
jgi:hypothetical protein